MIEPIGAALHAVAATHAAVPLVIRGAGAFPTLRRARVVWAGVDPAARLELLQHDLEVALDALGIPIEGRAFRPHVTLGRVKSPLDAAVREALARAARGFDFESEGPASSLDLMQSSLTQQGSAYRCLISAPLRAG
jgi:2'-5' RNA ligase